MFLCWGAGIRRISFTVLALALAAATRPAAAQAAGPEASAVVTSALGAYKEAYEAFSAEFGGPVRLYDLSASPDLPRGGLVAVFGGRAAGAGAYRGAERVVYCLAPGLDPAAARGVLVPMVPRPAAAVGVFSALQPGLKRLAVFYASASYEVYLKELAAAAREAGVELLPIRAVSPGEIPAGLRRMNGRAEAFWLLPDPALISDDAFDTMQNYSRANRVPFYAPTRGLAQKGATAAVYTGFAEMGRAAAAALKGGAKESVAYPARTSYAVNTGEADRIGLALPQAALAGAEVLFK